MTPASVACSAKRWSGPCSSSWIRRSSSGTNAGWVRNRGDGSVEAVFEGAPDDVERLVEAARRGPRGARVERLEVWEEPVEGVSGFSIVG